MLNLIHMDIVRMVMLQPMMVASMENEAKEIRPHKREAMHEVA